MKTIRRTERHKNPKDAAGNAPWIGECLPDPGQWPAARFFELLCGAEEGASEEVG